MALLEELLNHPRFATRSSDYIRWYPKSLKAFKEVRFLEAASPRGVYVHVPFCDKLCRFCPFNKRRTREEDVEEFLRALHAEIALYGRLCQGSELEFIYFGGGSPSVLQAGQLEELIAALSTHFRLRPGAEVTAECHPTHLTRQYVRALKGAGVTRISTGIQSLTEPVLRRIGAQHSAKQAQQAIAATTQEFGSLAIDLLFRCPGQSSDQWIAELEQVTQIAALEHVSMYSLVLKDEATQPSLREEAQMTTEGLEVLEGAGFRHYASCASGGFDLAKSEKLCRYELMHWAAPQAEFLGLGPGALGYVGNTTTVNGLGLDWYTASLGQARLPLVSATTASVDEQMRRYFVLGVKTLFVQLGEFRRRFGVDPATVFASEFERLRIDGLASVQDDCLVLSPVGRLFVDSVSAVFFSASEREVPHPEEPEIRRVEVRVKRAAPVILS